MDQNTHTSFIPKKSLTTATQNQNRGVAEAKSSIGIVFLITLIIFISVVALAIGVFLYQQFLFQNIEKKEILLSAREPLLSPH